MLRTSLASLTMVGLVAATPAKDGVRELPFEIASNKPFVQVSVNGGPKQWFIFDTGCAGGSVIGKEYAERAGFKTGTETKARVGAGEGAELGIATVPDITLNVGGVTMKSSALRVFPLGHVAPFEGRRIDGLIGEDFLRQNVVEIDYGKSRMRIIDPAHFAPAAGAISIPIDIEGGHAVAEGGITLPGGKSIPGRFVIDTGVRGTLVLYRPFAVTHGLLDGPGNLLNTTIGGGAGGETRGDIGRVEELRIGAAAFQAPVVIFSRDTVGVFASADPDGIIGGELLRRAKVTFDYPHARMLVEPYSRTPAPFEYDMSGLFLTARGDAFRDVIVQAVAGDTPAATAGLKKGDRIVTIDGRRAPLEEARRIFRAPGTRKLEVEREGRRLQVTLVTRRLV